MTNLNDLTTILTTAVGLIGVYVFFALFVSWLQEYVAWASQLRSKTLYLALRQLLGSDGAQSFFGGSMIQTLGDPFAQTQSSLSARLTRLFNRMPGGGYAGSFLAVSLPAQQRSIPTYMSARDFAANLITHAGEVAQANAAAAAFSAIGSLSVQAKQTLAEPLRAAASAQAFLAATRASPQALRAAGLHPEADAALARVRDLCPDRRLFSDATRLQADLQAAVDALPAGALSELLSSRLRDADGRYERFVAGLQNWFDDYMDRVSGWYKRCSTILTVYLSVAVVIALDIDSVSLFDALMKNDQLAQALSQVATSAYQAERSRPRAQTNVPTPAPGAAAALPAPPAPAPEVPRPSGPGFKSSAAGDCTVDASTLAALPLGWPDRRLDARLSSENLGLGLLDVLKKIAGLALTVVALALGAPFWFDLLGTIVNVRAAGSVPPKAAASTRSAPT